MLLISLICHTPIVIRGQHVNWRSFSRWNVRITRRWHVRLVLSERVLTRWRKLQTSSIRWCTWYRIVVSRWPSKRPAKCVHYVASSFWWLFPWWPPGQYRASSHPMAASSGFQWSPGGNAPPYLTGAPPWPSKWPATEVHLFAAAAYFDCCNRS